VFSPQIRVNGSWTASRPQGQPFVFDAWNLTPYGKSTRLVLQPSGRSDTLAPALYADRAGLLSWSFTPTCSTPVGTYRISIIDDATGRTSNEVLEVVTAGSCP
jgi:hypothetical protein